MPLLNTADAVAVGASAAQRVYLGSDLVWRLLTPVLVESFDVPDNAALVGDLTWAELNGGWSTTGGAAVVDAQNVTSYAAATDQQLAVDCYAKAIVSLEAAANFQYLAGVLLRWNNSATQNGYRFWVRNKHDTATYTAELHRFNAGAQGALATENIPPTEPGDELTLECSGTNPVRLVARVNGAIVATHDDSHADRIQAAAYSGIVAYRNRQTDSFATDAEVRSFESGSLS